MNVDKSVDKRIEEALSEGKLVIVADEETARSIKVGPRVEVVTT